MPVRGAAVRIGICGARFTSLGERAADSIVINNLSGGGHAAG